MNFPTPLVKSLLMAASIGLIVPMLAQTPAPQRAQATGQASEEPPPEVIGIERPWAGGLLGLAVEGNAFVLRFYDAEKNPIPTGDAARASARWNPVRKVGEDRTVLNPAGPGVLRSPAVVRPPHVFVVYLALLDEEGNALATLQFDMRETLEEAK